MIRSRVYRLATAASVAAVVSFAGPAMPASAAPRGAAGAGSGVASGATNGVAVGAVPRNSASLAGYELSGGGGPGSSQGDTATMVVPHVTCGSAYVGIGASAGMFNAMGNISAASLFVGCYNGTAHFWPSLTLDGTSTDDNDGSADASPGDVVTLTTHLSPTSTVVSVVNHTRNITRSLTGAGSSRWISPFIGDLEWVNGAPIGVPAFGTLGFSSCTVGGVPLARANPVGFRRVNSAGQVQIALGPLSAAGTAFTTYFVRH